MMAVPAITTSLGSLRLLLGDQLFLEQPRHGLPVPLRLRVRGLGLRELRLRRGNLALRLVPAALGVGARRIPTEPALPRLLVEDGDLVLGQRRSGLGLPDSGGCLSPTRAHLLVIEHGDRLPRLDAIAFPHGDLANSARGLRGHGGVVALDASAHRGHARRQRGRREHEAPDGEPGETEDGQRRDDREPTPLRAHGRRLRRVESAASPCVSRSWMCLTYAAASGGLMAGRRMASTRSRNRAVAKKKTRLPTRLRCVSSGSTGRKSPSATPRATLRCTAPRMRAGLSSSSGSRCVPPATTSRSIIAQKWGWRRVAISPTTAISSRSTSGAGRRDSASFATPATISAKVTLTIAR